MWKGHMEGLLSLLLFAAFFYVMMRFGCGAHMVHGHGSGHGEHAGDSGHGGRKHATARDPVCGVVVGLEVGELPLKITDIPEQHMVQKLSPRRPNQAFHERVR